MLHCVKATPNRLRFGEDIADLPSPISFQVDGYSRGVRSMLPIMIEYFPQGSFTARIALFRLMRTYGVVRFRGLPTSLRDAQGLALETALLSSKVYSAASREHLGLDCFAKCTANVVMDNGGGNIVGVASLRQS